ncbi:methyltransferase domain-containing protein [Nonomuraea jiangxiensis]|uniref:Ubiquinone/menaquinone biosynthesis C-methylase UbiE n=1 Tax=Nonomuraea jiangxiensis TaxID=633440 RepID=A0A1G8EP34_9ACTN|nr:methyltransferase domain-containing protein [Nonomuraea jiangxiensis]SDH71469.1 Ubiquinone/menaquinone biosynthesis C-methylase UbiE [Nonomuraea jiangxiensis]
MPNNIADEPDVATMIALLDATETLPGAAELRARTYELLDLPAGAGVVDVGCGAGRAVAELAERGARAVGVDLHEETVALAARRWPGRDFRLADACDLPFEDGELAGYRADKVYHELGDPARALREARRVLATGGRAVLAGQDWDTLVIDSSRPGLTRTIVHARADLVRTPRAARQYRNLLLDAGFRDVTVEVRTAVFTDAMMLPMLSGLAEAARGAGAITGEEAAAWVADQEERARAGRMFLALPLFVAAGRRA